MSATPILECIACGGSDLVSVLDLGEQPLANSYREDPNEVLPKYPLAINRCVDCSHVQLTHQVDPQEMFDDYLYVSGTSKTQRDYFSWFADLTIELFGIGPSMVLDIGCNDGSQLDEYKKRGLHTCGVDPAKNLLATSSKNHDVHCGYYTGDEFFGKFDIITCQNAFAHNIDQLALMKNVQKNMHSHSLFFATVSQAHMIERDEFDTIYHEHVSFYCVRSALAMAERSGLHLVDVFEHEIHGGSYIFVFSKQDVQHQSIITLTDRERKIGLYDDEIYDQYAKNCLDRIDRFRDLVNDCKSIMGCFTVGYGAPAKGSVLLNASGVHLPVIFEDNPLKVGRYVPGTMTKIMPSAELAYEPNAIVIPLAWNFHDEIFKKVQSINPTAVVLDLRDI